MEENAIPNAVQSSEKELIEDKSGKAALTEEELIKIRKEKIIRLLKKDKYFSAFVIAGILSLLFSFSIKFLNITYIISIFNPKEWLILGILAFISALLAYNKKYKLIFYPMLAWIVWLSIQIRTRNLPNLRDITTGTWTLGPDLDPFLFLRYAEYIVEHGNLFFNDVVRYVPLGFNTEGDYILHPYFIAWFHKIAVLFGSESVTHSAVLFPVFMFALSVIAFFLFSKEIFIRAVGKGHASIIALISSFFFSVIPIFLPRTIAGIPEKESAAFLFLFLAFYFFLVAWNSEKNTVRYIFIILSAFSTISMAFIWGGYVFIFLTIAPTIFIAFLLGKIDKSKIYTYIIWVVLTFSSMKYFFPNRYSLTNLFASISTAPTIVVLFVILIHFAIFNTKIKNYLNNTKIYKIPPHILSCVVSLIILVIAASIIFGISFIPNEINRIFNILVQPTTTRFIQTVAENRQPFFTEWVRDFGPYIKNIPILFWLFLIGSIYLFYNTILIFNKKERIYLTTSYIVFISGIIFSRYSSDSKLNGTNSISLIFYIISLVIFIFCVGFYYYKYYKKDKFVVFKNININIVLLFILFILCIIATRTAVRTIMMFVLPVSIITSYFIVSTFDNARKLKDKTFKLIAWVLVCVIIIAAIFTSYHFYKSINNEASIYAPSVYTQQWQKAMAWVRENTSQDAVFGHWWDYGYWLQSIGKRATVLDGGNSVGYWNHLMGRHALTGSDNKEALEFLYAHNVTHFLIDSSDIGKYGAFSSIGSDVNFDRRSFISTFFKDSNRVQEKKNSTILFYTGGTVLDGDLLYEDNGTKLFLPAGKAGIGAVLIEKSSLGEIISNPIGIFVYNNEQYNLPMRYVYTNNQFIDFGSGVESGAYIFPRISQSSFEPDGAMLYLSQRTVKSQFARLYLYKEESPYFKIAHSEDDIIIAQIKEQNQGIKEDIIFFNDAGGLRGPIRIWEVNYPSDIELKEQYLSTEYPAELYYA